MNDIIQSTLQTLQKSNTLLIKLSDEELSNATISPYYSSIGSHIRHIYDFYDCSLDMDNDGIVDLTARKRNLDVESCCDSAIEYLNRIVTKIKTIDIEKKKEVVVIDDLGSGKIRIDYTFAALLAQANSHTIHHYAIINYILDRLGISIEDSNFGYNPTTPKGVTNLN
ncbi:hypothetical protein [uncultured Lacinutrix sp.]|uniref:hypothetical protein n=1 Tax=uncultured Lacinutrix sp. TaxID=574032 RepID=UPI0026338761|nr:hypothetical protein [uncultured Lacinutrix sp.]